MATDKKDYSIATFCKTVIKIGQEGDYFPAKTCSVKNKGEKICNAINFTKIRHKPVRASA